MDFSEIIVTIIISLVIIAINALGSKKNQEVKNQQGERPLQDTDSHETTDEPWGEPRTLTIDDIFKELRKAKEEAEQEDDYIPKAKKKPQAGERRYRGFYSYRAAYNVVTADRLRYCRREPYQCKGHRLAESRYRIGNSKSKILNQIKTLTLKFLKNNKIFRRYGI